MTALDFRTELYRLRLSQKAYSRLSRIDYRTVRRWANGQRDIPAPEAQYLRRLTFEAVRQLMLEDAA